MTYYDYMFLLPIKNVENCFEISVVSDTRLELQQKSKEKIEHFSMKLIWDQNSGPIHNKYEKKNTVTLCKYPLESPRKAIV